MATLKQLKEEYGPKAARLREIDEKVRAENREWTEDEQKEFDELGGRCSELKPLIEAEEKRQDLLNQHQERAEQTDEQKRDEHRTGRRGYIGNEHLDDPNRPLTEAQHLRSVRGWMLQNQGSADPTLLEQDTKLAKRAGHNSREHMFSYRGHVGHEIPLSSADEVDANGASIQFPQNRTELRENAKRRYEAARQRDRDILEKRDSGIGDTGFGAETVPRSMRNVIEEALLLISTLRSVATIIPTTRGDTFDLPSSNDTGNTGEWLAEHAAAAELSVPTAKVSLEAWVASSKVEKVSIQLIQDSIVDYMAFAGRQLAKRIARIENTGFTTGDGTAKPHGVVTDAVDSATTFAAAQWTWSEMLTVKHTVDPEYRANGAWMAHDGGLAVAKKVADSQGRPIWLPSLIPGEPDLFDGDPFLINQGIATPGSSTVSLLYGDFSNYIIRDVRAVQMVRFDQLFMQNLDMGLLLYKRVDGRLLNAGTNPIKYATTAA